jgi:hypothetical protein
MGNKISNVKNRVWCELVKLHTVHKKKPTKELMGRERKTMQEKSKKHHSKAARGLGDPLGAREGDLIIAVDEAISVGLVQLLLPILFFCARCLTRIYGLRMGAVQELRGAQGLQQWWRQKRGTGKQ